MYTVHFCSCYNYNVATRYVFLCSFKHTHTPTLQHKGVKSISLCALTVSASQAAGNVTVKQTVMMGQMN